MKPYLLCIIFCLSCFVAVGAELSEKRLEEMGKNIKIGSVKSDSTRRKNGEKIEVFMFSTYQSENDKYNFQVRVTIELTEKKSKEKYLAQLVQSQGAVHLKDTGNEYTGDDNWRFELLKGGLDRPKVTAYAIQYGVLSGEKFVILAEEFDDVDSLAELLERTPTFVKETPVIKHQYAYLEPEDVEVDDSEDGAYSVEDSEGRAWSKWE